MHLEILVEDQSGKKALDILVPKIIENKHTFVVHPYKGIGRMPKDMRDTRDASKRILMDNLPKLLKRYGKTQAGRLNCPEAVILVCDLDDKCLKTFGILNACSPKHSIQGTWEKLADAVYPGGSSTLSKKGWQVIGAEKSKWAEAITAHMNVANNRSPSFCYFIRKIQELTGVT